MAILEGKEKNITNEGPNAAESTKDFSEVIRLNEMISETEKNISSLYFQLGFKFFEDNKNDPPELYLSIFSEISRRFEDMYSCKDQLKSINGIISCPNCGAEIPDHSNFCNICGQKIDASAQDDASAETAVCDDCGHDLPEENESGVFSGDETLPEPEEENEVPAQEAGDGIVFRVKILCPNCGNSLNSNATSCNKCGVSISPIADEEDEEDEVETPKAEESIESNVKITCSNCGNELGPDMLFCNKCGTPSSPKASADDDIAAQEPKKEEIHKSVCSNCGSELSPDMMFCTVCGASVHPKTSTENAFTPQSSRKEDVYFKKVCSNCGNELSPDMMFCTVCGASAHPKANAENVFAAQTSRKEDVYRRVCQNCGNELTPEMLFCTDCGMPTSSDVNAANAFAAQKSRQEDVYKRVCANCGNELSPGMLFCTACGRKI